MAALPPREQRHPFLRYQGLEYTNADIADFEERLERIYSREIHRGSGYGFSRDARALFARMVMKQRNDASVVVFTIRAWGRLFDTRGPLLGGTRRRLSWRQFILALGLHIREEMESLSFARDFLGPPPSYTLIRDPILRLCHRMMAHSIAGRSQAPEKIYKKLDDTWVWVAIGLKRQPDAATGAPRVAQDAPIVDMGGQADSTPVQAQPPPAAARTMPQRIDKLEEDVHEIRRTLVEQHEVISAMAHDFSRFYTWTTTSLARMMDRAGVAYMSYSEAPREYTRHMRHRIDGASTSAAQQDQQQLDP
ncbi:hypothetical protein Tco_0710080, partial [Tanacetum coccineum]